MAWPTTAETLPEGVQNDTHSETGEPDPAGYAAAGGTDPTGVGDHAERHNDLAGAINRTWTELGTNPSGSDADVAARLAALDLVVAGKANFSALKEAAFKDVGTGSTQVAAGNDSRFPTAGQKNALAGANGTPGEANKYLTEASRTALEAAYAAQVAAEKERAEAAEALRASKAELTAAIEARAAGDAAEKARAEAAEALKANLTDSRFPVAATLTANVGPIKETTVLQNITGLAIPIGASGTEIWRFFLWLYHEAANATGDFKLGFSVPAGTTMVWGSVIGNGNNLGGSWATPIGTNSSGVLNDQTTEQVIGARSGGGKAGAWVTGLIFGGGTAGNVQARFAQNTSDPGNNTILKGSTFEALKVAA